MVEAYQAGKVREGIVSGSRKEQGELIQPTIIVYAGQSPRRESFLRYVFKPPIFQVVTAPGGKEEPIDNVVSIARDKITHARKILSSQNIVRPGDRIAYIAGDVQTRPLTVDEHGNVNTKKSLGKPKKPEHVKSVFEKMHEASQISGVNPYYTIYAGSVGLIEQGRRKPRIQPPIYHTVTIELDPKKIRRYATSDRGFGGYLNELRIHYNSPVYTQDGTHPPLSATDLSAGLSLSTLMRLDAIAAIDGTSREDPKKFKDLYTMALYYAGVGISPETLKPLKPSIKQDIKRWPFLRNNVALALDGTK